MGKMFTYQGKRLKTGGLNMAIRNDLKEIVKRNPHVSEDELETLHQTILKLRRAPRYSQRACSKFAPPYSRPSVRREREEQPPGHTAQLTRP